MKSKNTAMKIRKMKNLIRVLIICVVCILTYFTFFTPVEEKAHFIEKDSHRKLLVLEKLLPGQKQPVFNVSLIKNRTYVVNKTRPLILPGFELRKNNIMKDKNREQLLRDELPLLAPDWNCTAATYESFQTESYCLPHHDVNTYFLRAKARYCLKEGTAYIIKNDTECYCKARWHGHFCSMPKVAYNSEYPRTKYAYSVAEPPRRIINAFPFTHEFHMLEARLHEYKDVVDLYVIVESNYTAAGFPRTRLLLERLKSGYLKEYQHKMLYVELGYFPRNARYNGWIVDALLRNHLASEGLSKITNLIESDVIVLNDADELPVREALLFLKLHRGYPEPVGFHLVHNVYGFYWIGNDFLSHAFGACSVGMLLHFFDWKLYNLRSARAEMGLNIEMLNHYKYYHGGAITEWSFGQRSSLTPGGWHCSWCFTPKGIKTKLEGAHWSDLPRWGAYPSKTTENYIRNLTIQGLWFDDKTALLPAPPRTDEWFAPQYLKSHYDEYQYLLVKPTLMGNNK